MAWAHAEGMAARPLTTSPTQQEHRGRFGAGLTEPEVARFRNILREECGAELSLPEAWSCAIELLLLIEMLLEWRGVFERQHEESTRFALPRS